MAEIKTLSDQMTKALIPSAIRLLGFSFLILFFELALIRFIPANVQAAAYFINLVLIATFLGMGTGLIFQLRRKEIAFLFPPFLLVLICICGYLANTIIQIPSSSAEFLWGTYFPESTPGRRWGLIPTISLLFIFLSVLFIPLGQAMGREFEKFPALIAYCINIMGSLLGIGVFALFSKYATPPFIWFLVGIIVFLCLSHQRRILLISLICFPAVLFMVNNMRIDSNEIWSPYYRINHHPIDIGTAVKVNKNQHQLILDFSLMENPFICTIILS